MLDYSKSFIETQFPVSKISKESYKERKANLGQTLTGLGKWWGRKPLILVRATILGSLLPISDNPKKDRDIFLKLLTMDEEGLKIRKEKNIQLKNLYDMLTTKEREQYFEYSSSGDKPKYKKGIKLKDKNFLQEKAFDRMSYDEKLKYCVRPEHVEELPDFIWKDINNHLGTSASTFTELIKQLGEKRFGHTPRIGDAFSGGGSIPFEAARIGANAYGSDLNPVASLLTWSAINISGSSVTELESLKSFQQKVYKEVDLQITDWQIEHNEDGHRADTYLYCNESHCPECGYKVPLAPSWVIGKGTKTVALLYDNEYDGFNIEVIQGATKEQFKKAENMITVKNNKMFCPKCEMETPIQVLRGDRKDKEGNTVTGLRQWEKDEFIPREDDVYLERLYCIRYVKQTVDENGQSRIERYYKSPSKEDLKREERVINLLSQYFEEWQEEGYLPSESIEAGYNTSQPIRERGWNYWHQLFYPRQLLIHGLFAKLTVEMASNDKEKVLGLLGINKLANWNSKLSQWLSDGSNEKGAQTFSNQALNTMYNSLSRTFLSLKTTWFYNINNYPIETNTDVSVVDARSINKENDLWITDPPYADAVNYHELSEFFLSWDRKLLKQIFPEWYTDSKEVLAVKGTGETFNKSMVEIYKNLKNNMPHNGVQVVMFTHQNVKVWAELASILWAAGLKVSSAWTIATETDAGGLREGNYVQGTVLLILRKQTSNEVIFQDELYRKIKREVKSQIDSMKYLDDREDPNFTDADYLLASYAAALKILTSYKDIEGIDIEYELSKPKSVGNSPIEELVNKAKSIAYDYLIPQDFEAIIWRDLGPDEQFYIRGLELEIGNVYQVGAYQELAKGFGVKEYKNMFENFKANTVRFKTASEFRSKSIDNNEFGKSLLRHVLSAIYQSIDADSTEEGKNYLKAKYDINNEYWDKRTAIIELLSFISKVERIPHMQHWHRDALYARLLKESIRNDGI